VLAEDNDTYSPGPAPILLDHGEVPQFTEVKGVTRLLFVGWYGLVDIVRHVILHLCTLAWLMLPSTSFLLLDPRILVE
jgi:hypothetical protein